MNTNPKITYVWSEPKDEHKLIKAERDISDDILISKGLRDFINHSKKLRSNERS